MKKEDKDKTPEDDKDKDSTGEDDSGKPTDREDKEDDISLNPQVEIKDPPFLSTNLTINTFNKSTMDWFKLLNE